MTRRKPLPDRAAALEALYAELPTIDCKGACWTSCGPIRMTGLEHRRVEEAGVAIPEGTAASGLCPALTMLRRCAVYDSRPTICRLFGLTRNLRCSHGCMPSTGRLLTDEEGYDFLARAHEIAGEQAQADQLRARWRQFSDTRQLTAALDRQRLERSFAEGLLQLRLAVRNSIPPHVE